MQTMMTLQHKQYLIFCLISFLVGILFFVWHNEMLIIKFSTRQAMVLPDQSAQKQLINLYFLKDTKELVWHKEQQEVVLAGDKAKAAQYIISRLFNVLLEEKIIPKQAHVQHAMIDNAHELYISFNRSPFAKQSSTYEKWMLIESILKTLKENGVQVQSVRFLVNHHPLLDNQLDFTKGWPITGFL